MRNFGILIGRGSRLRPPATVSERLARVTRPAGHPLDEEVRELFQCACTAGDLEAANDVLLMMERWMERRTYENEQQRKEETAHLLRMRGELERRYIMKGIRPPVPRVPASNAKV